MGMPSPGGKAASPKALSFQCVQGAQQQVCSAPISGCKVREVLILDAPARGEVTCAVRSKLLRLHTKFVTPRACEGNIDGCMLQQCIAR